MFSMIKHFLEARKLCAALENSESYRRTKRVDYQNELELQTYFYETGRGSLATVRNCSSRLDKWSAHVEGEIAELKTQVEGMRAKAPRACAFAEFIL